MLRKQRKEARLQKIPTRTIKTNPLANSRAVGTRSKGCGGMDQGTKQSRAREVHCGDTVLVGLMVVLEMQKEKNNVIKTQ